MALVQAYDMLPVAFRRASNGELVARDHHVVLPTPDQRDTWQQTAAIALSFRASAADDPRISVGFHAVIHELLDLATRPGTEPNEPRTARCMMMPTSARPDSARSYTRE